MCAGLHAGDEVQRPVELAVATPVQPMSLDLAGRGGDGGGAGDGGEGGLRAEAAHVTRLAEQLGGE
jgi:hypothetical protein